MGTEKSPSVPLHRLSNPLPRHMGLSDCCLRTNYWSTHVSQCMLAVQAAGGSRLPRHMQRGTHIPGKAWGPWWNDGKAYKTFRLLSSHKLLINPCVSMRGSCAGRKRQKTPTSHAALYTYPWQSLGTKAYGTFPLLSSQKLLVHPCVSMRANCATASGRRLPHHMQRGTHIPGKAWGPWRNASQHYDKRMFASTQEPANMTTTLAFPPDVDRSMSDAV